MAFEDLRKVFHVGLCNKGHKHIGLLCSEEEHTAWNNKYKDKRYSINQPNGKLTSGDGIHFFVNTQWSLDGLQGILKLAIAEGFKVTTKTDVPMPGLFE